MGTIKHRLKVRVPKEIIALYCSKKNLLSFLNTENKKIKTIKPEFKVIFIKKFDRAGVVYVTSIPTTVWLSNKLIKKIPEQQGSLVSVIEKTLLEVKTTFYKKIKFVGVGYRMLPSPISKKHCTVKLGYSHPVFYCLPGNVKIFCPRYDRFTLYNEFNYYALTQTLAKLRRLRKPEPYKGKGVLYLDEKITLKQGKRV